jgi:hypothetical protein
MRKAAAIVLSTLILFVIAIGRAVEAQTPSSATAGTSRGFIPDILSDSSGYSFHRFQIFAWTIVLGIMFISSVYNKFTMPEFSATLLIDGDQRRNLHRL